MKNKLIALVVGGAFCTISSYAQIRAVVLPFRNSEGDIKYNAWTFALADSLRTSLLAYEPGQKNFTMVPADSVEMAVSELNLDPTNPQYESDVWKAVASMGVTKVVWGNFFLRNGKVLLNAYVYDIQTKIADPVNQAKDLYKSPENYLESVKAMTKKLYPGIK